MLNNKWITSKNQFSYLLINQWPHNGFGSPMGWPNEINIYQWIYDYIPIVIWRGTFGGVASLFSLSLSMLIN